MHFHHENYLWCNFNFTKWHKPCISSQKKQVAELDIVCHQTYKYKVIVISHSLKSLNSHWQLNILLCLFSLVFYFWKTFLPAVLLHGFFIVLSLQSYWNVWVYSKTSTFSPLWHWFVIYFSLIQLLLEHNNR